MGRKNTVRLTESDLKRIITESVKQILGESIELAKNVPVQIQGKYIEKMKKEYPDLDPDGFFYMGGTLKHSGKKAKRVAKNERVKLVRKEGESNSNYAQRLSQVDPKFAEEYKKHEGEEFRPIENVMGRLMGGNVDYTDTYEVSNMGTFRVMDGAEGRGVYPHPYLQRKHGQEIEYQIHLTKGDDGCFVVKNIVAFAFPDIVKQPFNLSDYQSYAHFTKQWGVTHIDGDKSNNAASNLKWVQRQRKMKSKI